MMCFFVVPQLNRADFELIDRRMGSFHVSRRTKCGIFVVSYEAWAMMKNDYLGEGFVTFSRQGTTVGQRVRADSPAAAAAYRQCMYACHKLGGHGFNAGAIRPQRPSSAPAGVREEQWIDSASTLDYMIRFEKRPPRKGQRPCRRRPALSKHSTPDLDLTTFPVGNHGVRRCRHRRWIWQGLLFKRDWGPGGSVRRLCGTCRLEIDPGPHEWAFLGN